MPRGIILGMCTLILSAFMIVLLNPAVTGVGSFKLSTSGEPLLDGFRAIYGSGAVVILGIVALTGLIASFHTILYAMGRQVYSAVARGLFPDQAFHHRREGEDAVCGDDHRCGRRPRDHDHRLLHRAADQIGTTLLNMAVFGAMCSYILQAVSFILLRVKLPDMVRPYRSPFGIVGAALTILIAVVTLYYQLGDKTYQMGIYSVLACSRWASCTSPSSGGTS